MTEVSISFLSFSDHGLTVPAGNLFASVFAYNPANSPKWN